ncbi:MAG: glycosyltransferase [Bacteroidetes bacterium]|nr:glycosyltransferase [Bacteroidota bacterium]
MTATAKHFNYFESIASGRPVYRKKRSYYWKDIAHHCGYFIHERSSVLEIGCGTGELLNDIIAKRKVGIDFSPAMIKCASENYHDIQFYVMNAEDIRLDEKFDVVILSNVIGFLNDVEKVLKAIHKVCHPRTKIIITYYNYLWEPFIKLAEWTVIKKPTPPQNWLTQEDISNLLFLAGFEVYRTSRRMFFPFYVPIVSEFLNRFLAHLPVFNWFALNIFCFARPAPNPLPEPVRDYSVSVIIPARNEEGNIEAALERMPSLGSVTEIIFVEGHSGDNTWKKIEEAAQKFSNRFPIKIFRQEGRGKADAVRKGFEHATGDILMILDADLTVPPEDLQKFYRALVDGKGEFINGSRLVYPVEKQAMRFLNQLGNRFFSIVFSYLLNRHIKDTLCGTKALFREDYLKIKENRKFFGDFDPFGDYDLLFGAHKLSLKIIDLPIRYQERKYGTTNISRFSHGWLLLRMCWFAARKIKFD